MHPIDAPTRPLLDSAAPANAPEVRPVTFYRRRVAFGGGQADECGRGEAVGLLNYKIGTGPNHYVACVIATLPADSTAALADPLTAWSAVFAADTALPAGGITVSVPVGAPSLTAALRDADGNIPSNVIVTVTQPDGTILDQPTEPFDPERVVTILEGSLVNLLVRDPQPGDWKIDVVSTNNDDVDYGFLFSTVPSSDGPATVDATLRAMADPNLAKRYATLAGLVSTECFWCKIGCYALAVILTALAAAGATFITAGAAPVVALTALLGVAASTAVAMLTAALAAIAASVDIAVTYICSWANVCEAPSARPA